MLNIPIARLKEELDTIKRILAFNDRARLGVNNKEIQDAELANIYQSLSELSWRQYEHSAAFTRIYALYEKFIFDMVAVWLDLLPQHHENYVSLPDSIKRNYRNGIGSILPKLDNERYKHLSEERMVKSFGDALNGGTPYSLLSEAFLTDDRNLWRAALESLFARIGVEGCWEWVTNHRFVLRYLSEIRNNESTAESELTNFVLYRNQAAHGNNDQIVSTSEVGKYANFILAMCESLVELVADRCLEKQLKAGKANIIGNVIKQFNKTLVGVEMNEIIIRTGETYLIHGDYACYEATVESLGYKNKKYEFLNIGNSDPIAIKFNVPIKINHSLVKLSSAEISNSQPTLLISYAPQ